MENKMQYKKPDKFTLRLLNLILTAGYRFAYKVMAKNEKLGNIVFDIIDKGIFSAIMELK